MTKDSKLSRLQRVCLGIILILGGIMLGVIILELGLRLLPLTRERTSTSDDTYVCSSTIGWTGRPNYQTFYVKDEFAHPLQRNAKGMYDTDHSIEKADDTFRILLVGDSFTEALQVDEPQTAHQVLENLLNERLGTDTKSYEVLSMGVSGWGTGQQLLYYREEGHLYNPDLVVMLFFIGNDLIENLPGYAFTIDGFNCFTPYFSVCDGQLDPEPWDHIPGLDPAWGSCSSTYKWFTGSLGKLRYNSYLVAALDPLLISLKERRVFGNEFTVSYIALYLPQENEETNYSWQVAEGLLAQFNREVAADGRRFAVAFFGPREVVWLSQFDEGQLSMLLQSDPHLREAEIDRPNRRLSNFFADQNIPSLDLQPIIIDHMAQTKTELYWAIDRHWTAEGNEVVAEALFQWLVDNNLLE